MVFFNLFFNRYEKKGVTVKYFPLAAAFLLIASGSAFANEGVVSMALDRAHALGFNGCDKEISKEFSRDEYRDSVYVGAQVPFHADYGDGLKAPNDELMLITNAGLNGLRSKIFRKFDNKCLVSGEVLSAPINVSCAQYNYGNVKVVAETAGMRWRQNVDSNPRFNAKYERQGATGVLINLPNSSNSCWQVTY